MPAMECQRRNVKGGIGLKGIRRKCLALLTTLAMLFSWAIPVYAAGEICQVQYDVTYGQTEARTMLAMINDSGAADGDCRPGP